MRTNNGLAPLVGVALFVMMMTVAHAQLTTLGAGSKAGAAAAAPTGKLLLVDGVSFILQTDGASKICLAGGC